MQRISFVLLFLSLCIFCNAQPAKRRVISSTKNTAKTTASAEKKADRAALMFPTSAEMPEDVVWRRDIYRQLDLLKDVNAPLYYPVEPRGKEQNLFTYLFRLWLSGRINAYQYKLDGNESFDEKDKADVKELLDRYFIYYEENNGKIIVPESDIPSAEVTRYYIKESSYFDQRSATYKTRVTALCPVLMRGADFADAEAEATPYPLFWIKYDDAAAYLSRMPIMASNLNNVTNMTVDDYFTMNRYDGKIYKTNNLQGRVLPNDSTRIKEQERIEKQLKQFEENIWHYEAPVDSLDSINAAKDEKASTKVKAKTEKKKEEKTSRRSASVKTKAPKSSSAPRVSARRQRR
ncbi:MAG: gliding motility protein GldN [Bacteroidales bacterium]|nr:gliding motility protein GldN [Bacteroidales bacterium]